jgi:hypothetical protein
VRQLQPGQLISREAGMAAAIEATAQLCRDGLPERVYQPAFQAGELAVIADVLECHHGSVTLTEVKASFGIKPEHLPDVAFQTLVLKRAGIQVDRVLLMHLDSSFVLQRAGDYDGLLHASDVTMEAEESLAEIEGISAKCVGLMAQPVEPVVRTGPQCNSPRECPYLERCVALEGGRAEYPVEILKRAPAVVRSLRRAGFDDLRDVPAARLKTAKHQRIHQATVTGEAYVDRAAAAEVTGLGYPIAYLDFETVGPAIPQQVGDRPYQHRPFQFSVHVEAGPDQLLHREYLAEGLPLDLPALAASLVAALPDHGPVLAYNAGFEANVLRDLAERVPAHAEALLGIADRLIDLLPVTRRSYYHRDMRGSWSFKAVLPTVDPALSYADLEGVQASADAPRAFLELSAPETTKERRQVLREQLLRYCGRDTYGMVVLRRFLAGEAVQPVATAGN